MVAEWSCSVTAAPFSRPVSPVFVTSDVSIKTGGRHQNQTNVYLPPPPTPPLNRPYCHHDPPRSSPPFTRDPAPDCLGLFSHLPLTRTHKPEGPIVPVVKKEKKKSSGKERKLGSCSWLVIFIRFRDVKQTKKKDVTQDYYVIFKVIKVWMHS